MTRHNAISSARNAAELIPTLRGLVASLPAGPAAAARFVTAHPADAVPMTMRQLAAAAGTSEASVLRMTRAAECSGYREFRTRLTSALAAMPREGDATGGFDRDDPPQRVLAKLAAQERQAIADTAAALRPDDLRGAAEAIIAARRVLIVGIGASGLVARDLAAKLDRIGIVATAVVEGHAALTSAVALRPEDLLVAISASGETTDTVEPLWAAIDRGAATIAITAHRLTSLDAATWTLTAVAADEQALRPAAMSSRTGQSFVVDALFIVVLQRMPDSARDAISTSYASLRERRRPGHPSRSFQTGPEPTTTKGPLL